MADFQLHPSRELTVLIPARAGSKRVPGKNTRMLGGKPLIQWTIEAAQAAHVADIIVSTDDDVTAQLAHAHGCRVHTRKPEHATDDAPDILWVRDVLPMVHTPIVAILRPTSPFRTASTIRRAYALLKGSDAHSVRAVETVTQHPGKMWITRPGSRYMIPLLEHRHPDGTPWHSSPTQRLPLVYVQNASLEMARVWAIQAYGTISGQIVAPFLTDPRESLDINTEADFTAAQDMLSRM